jgi:transcriptional regulator with XRE-family HTH domain
LRQYQFKPLPSDIVLATTLARRVGQLRDFRNMTIKDLGKLSRLGEQRIEDIEAGLETWLSVTERQLLAKALVVEPYLIQEVESKPPADDEQAEDAHARLVQAILRGARDLECPNCGGTLRCSVADALDIEGQPTRFAKAYCMKCPYVLR